MPNPEKNQKNIFAALNILKRFSERRCYKQMKYFLMSF